jgi:hypothetical protein
MKDGIPLSPAPPRIGLRPGMPLKRVSDALPAPRRAGTCIYSSDPSPASVRPRKRFSSQGGDPGGRPSAPFAGPPWAVSGAGRVPPPPAPRRAATGPPEAFSGRSRGSAARRHEKRGPVSAGPLCHGPRRAAATGPPHSPSSADYMIPLRGAGVKLFPADSPSSPRSTPASRRPGAC